jgi:hypothetical protein
VASGGRVHDSPAAALSARKHCSRRGQFLLPIFATELLRLHDHGHCVGFLRSAGPRGFQAYDADGIPIGIFQDKAAAVEAITAASSMAETENQSRNPRP